MKNILFIYTKFNIKLHWITWITNNNKRPNIFNVSHFDIFIWATDWTSKNQVQQADHSDHSWRTTAQSVIMSDFPDGDSESWPLVSRYSALPLSVTLFLLSFSSFFFSSSSSSTLSSGGSSLVAPSSSLTQPAPCCPEEEVQGPLQCLEVRGRSPSHLEPAGLQLTGLVSTP